MSYVPTIDEGTCIAQGDCAELASDVFVVDDHARTVAAIPIVDSETGEIVYP